MTFYVYGGSNSIFRDGWVSYFSERIGETPVNRSVGATTTLSGLFRFLSEVDTDHNPSGSCVIWEYALNEVNHIKRGYDQELLLKNVEHFMVLCRERGLKFVPVVFTPWWQERAPQRDKYYDLLSDLFQHYKVLPFDVSAQWRQNFGVPAMEARNYMNDAHYACTPYVMDFISAGVVRMVSQAAVPAEVDPVYTSGSRVRLIDGINQDRFQNSLMTVPTANLPVSVNMTGTGRISAVCVLSQSESESGVRLRITRDGKQTGQMRFSITNDDHKGVLFKAVSLQNANGDQWHDRWSFHPGDRLLLTPSRQAGEYYAEDGVRPSLSKPDPDAPTRICGVLVEIAA